MKLLFIVFLTFVFASASDATNRKILLKALENFNTGPSPQELQNGLDIYKHVFGKYPHLRVYFKGKEDYTPEMVQEDPYFTRQGKNLLLAIHVLASTYDNKPAFKAYARDLLERHHRNGALFPILVEHLETKTPIDSDTKNAFVTLGKDLFEEIQVYLKELGVPK